MGMRMMRVMGVIVVTRSTGDGTRCINNFSDDRFAIVLCLARPTHFDGFLGERWKVSSDLECVDRMNIFGRGFFGGWR